MSLLDFDGSVKYVWNPFSLAQLKAKLGGLETYLDCIASNTQGSCTAPSDPIFDKQQIPLLSVYQRCLSNYQDMTWDQGSFVMFNASLQKSLGLSLIMPSSFTDTFNVAPCLLAQRTMGYDNTGCLVDYFLKGTQAIDYFKYENITDPTPASATVDACLTFSGPAALADANISTPFIACLENYANRSGCDIPHMLWTGRSTNKVPVATQHAVGITDMALKLKWAQGDMMAVKNAVLSSLDRIEREWTGDALKITLFSSEGMVLVGFSSNARHLTIIHLLCAGDLLHQFADCVMQVVSIFVLCDRTCKIPLDSIPALQDCMQSPDTRCHCICMPVKTQSH